MRGARPVLPPTGRTPDARRGSTAYRLLGAAAGAALFFPTLAGAVEAPRPNLLLITVDSVRPDRLRAYNPASGVPMPHVERLASSGTIFRNAWAVAPWTAPSVVSIHTGLYPPSHGVIVRDDSTPPAMPTLATVLAAEGYRIGNFAFFSEISYYRNLGFPPPQKGAGYAGAASGFARWVTESEPFFAWHHLVEAHLPYGRGIGAAASATAVTGSSGLDAVQRQSVVPVGSADFEPGDDVRIRQLYAVDLHWLDDAIGEVLRALDGKPGLRERTIVVLVADHGDEQLEHGWVGHASTAHQARLTPEVLRIPLIVSGPGFAAGATSAALVQQVDLLPALAHALKFTPPATVDGHGLADATPGADRRTWAFFDSAAAGHLTPDQRRSERKQGITDGIWIVEQTIVPGTPAGTRLYSATTGATDPPSDAAAPADGLRALRRWKDRQSRQRALLLQRYKPEQWPAPIEVAAYAESIVLVSPEDDARLDFVDQGGQIVLQWQPSAAHAVIEYDIGEKESRFQGRIPAEGFRASFGPLPEGVWDDLSQFNPFRFRVVDVDGKRRSPWRSFRVEAAAWTSEKPEKP